MFLNDVPSPFNLLRPKAWWMKILSDYDPDLRIFPSQKQPVYRVMRVARLSGGLNYDRMRVVLPVLHPDTQIALERHLVPVMTFGPDVFNRHPSIIVNILRRRDTWRIGGGDKAADALDRMEVEAAEQARAAWREEGRVRRRAMAIAHRYRTGARVSLVRPRRDGIPASQPTGGPVAPPSA